MPKSPTRSPSKSPTKSTGSKTSSPGSPNRKDTSERGHMTRTEMLQEVERQHALEDAKK